MFQLTAAGRTLCAAVNAGTETMTITHVAFGSGRADDGDIPALTGLVSEVARVEPANGVPDPDYNQYIFDATLSNSIVPAGASIIEAGIFVQAGDSGEEFLYAYHKFPDRILLPPTTEGQFSIRLRVPTEILTPEGVSIPVSTEIASYSRVLTQTLALTSPCTPPSSTPDDSGTVGEITYDDNFVYIKTPSGWLRAALTTF